MDFLRTRPGRQTSVCSLMAAICSCFFAFLRVALLLLESCLSCSLILVLLGIGSLNFISGVVWILDSIIIGLLDTI